MRFSWILLRELVVGSFWRTREARWQRASTSCLVPRIFLLLSVQLCSDSEATVPENPPDGIVLAPLLDSSHDSQYFEVAFAVCE